MKTNLKSAKKTTYEGAPASSITPIQELRRTCLACLLWENHFYENGEDSQKRVEELCTKVSVDELKNLIIECFEKQKLRHMPLKLIVELLKKPNNQAKYLISRVCTRPDQMTELLSLYWITGKKPLDKQLQRGLAHAFRQYDDYQLAKYNRNNVIKLRDVLFLSHAKPENDRQAKIWNNLINDKLMPAETWETKLSAGENKKEAFSELLAKGKMGTIAILRNLRNMRDQQVNIVSIFENLEKGRPVLPFEYFRAANAIPEWQNKIATVMLKHLTIDQKLPGTTMVFVDVSSSMDTPLSAKSDIRLIDAACMFAVLLREWCEMGTTISFSNEYKFIKASRGFELIDDIKNSQCHAGTYLGNAIKNALAFSTNIKIDRIIVITDEQSADNIPHLDIPKKYFISLGNYKNQLKTDGSWVHVTGFSENTIQYIIELERPVLFSTN
ncbi:MAG TPA: TROVE domain-containing protein [Candidatus Sulfotelmatobacter sp.]|jgi:60 kDa SS-A/Ro ribonucleoprotein|nr:TROVE domain-containing protein [Candidatus Sulfotelmatobacter sp.]